VLRKTPENNYIRTDAPKKTQKKLYENKCCGNKIPRQNDMRTDAPKNNRKKTI
jgi:hypothetical protein